MRSVGESCKPVLVAVSVKMRLQPAARRESCALAPGAVSGVSGEATHRAKSINTCRWFRLIVSGIDFCNDMGWKTVEFSLSRILGEAQESVCHKRPILGQRNLLLRLNPLFQLTPASSGLFSRGSYGNTKPLRTGSFEYLPSQRLVCFIW